MAQAVSQWLTQRRPDFELRSGHVGFVVDKVALGRFSPSTSVSPSYLHSTNCSAIAIIYHLGLVQDANIGRSTKWTHVSLTPLGIINNDNAINFTMF
jgi:hypothetical protein